MIETVSSCRADHRMRDRAAGERPRFAPKRFTVTRQCFATRNAGFICTPKILPLLSLRRICTRRARTSESASR